MSHIYVYVYIYIYTYIYTHVYTHILESVGAEALGRARCNHPHPTPKGEPKR